jgi:transposase
MKPGTHTFKQFQAIYPDDAACLAKMMEVNYGGTEISCPGCGADSKFHPLKQRRAFVCQLCGHHIYPCAGTIFHKSPTNLTKWFFAMYLMTSTRSGVAAKELERALGVTYKCAWRMAHEIRKLMASADYAGPMGGPGKHVEIDETLIGGEARRHGKGKGRRAKKSVVMGMVERDGMLRTGPVADDRNFTLEPIVLENVLPDTVVTTDGHTSYQNLGLSYQHGVVKHSEKEYVVGIHHTNTIEGHWSHFKRAIKGTHVHISGKHLWKYCAEFNYRRNYRSSQQFMFDRLVAAFALPRLQDS